MKKFACLLLLASAALVSTAAAAHADIRARGDNHDVVRPARVRLVNDGYYGDRWRYRYHNGTWWYWLPSNRWCYWTGDDWSVIGYDSGYGDRKSVV